MCDQSRSSRFQAAFESALQDYETQTGITLVTHPFTEQFEKCLSVASITSVLQDHAKALGYFRGRKKIMRSIERTAFYLCMCPTFVALGDSIGSPFLPAKAIYTGLTVLLDAAKGMRASYNALVNLLQLIEHLLKHLKICTTISPVPAMDEIVVNIMVGLLAAVALATRRLNWELPMKDVKRHLGVRDIQAVLQRIDRLTQDEARTTALQTLAVIYALVQNMGVIMNSGAASMDAVWNALEIVHQMASDINKSKRDKLQQDIRSWLSPPDACENYNFARESRYNMTGEWFVHGNTFSEWKRSGPSSLLWIHGKPGSGKSVLCSTIIQDIDAMRKSGLASLTYFFYDYRDDQKKNLHGLLSLALFQLCVQSDPYYDILSTFYSSHYHGAQRPSDDELVRCFKELVGLPGQAPVYLVVDALDECPSKSALRTPREDVLTLLKDLVNSQLPNLRIGVTSRTEVDIKAVLEPLTFHSFSLHDECGQKADIKYYIKSFVNTNTKMRGWTQEHKQLVIDRLTKRAEGSFRWVYCQLDHLGECPPTRILPALDEIPETLAVTYERILQEISDTNWEFSRRLLSCVAVASRPLRVEELAELLAFDFTTGPIPRFREDWRLKDPLRAVLSTCSTLLILVNVDGAQTMRFAHSSAKQFLTSAHSALKHNTISHRYHIPLTSAHTLMAQACLGILLHLHERITGDSLKRFPLAEYAAQYWADHARFKGVSQNVEEGMKQLFDPRRLHLAVWVWIWDPLDSSSPFQRGKRLSPPRETPMQYAAFYGFNAIVKFLAIEHPEDVKSRNLQNGLAPLHWARQQGNVEVARLLIEHGADVDATYIDGSTPLHRASYEGQVEVVRLLLEHGADVNALCIRWSTPVHLAWRQGHMEVVLLLIEHGADANAQYIDGSTSLHWASREGRVDIARFLIQNGADVNALCMDYSTPLRWAWRQGHMAVVRLLIEHGADVNALYVDGSTPLHWAAREGRAEIAHFLLEHGADANALCLDGNGSSPLRLAWRHGHVGVVLLLIQHGADVNARYFDGLTLLHWVSRSGRAEIARFLIQHGAGADVNALCMGGSTSLHWASHKGRVEVVRLLTEHGVDVNAQCIDGSTPLHWALRERHAEVSRLLIQRGANVNAQCKDGSTPLHWESREGHVEGARLLIEYGADPTARDKDNWTPLHWAAHEGRVDSARLLIEHGAYIITHDRHGLTPLHHAWDRGDVSYALALLEHATAWTHRWLTPLHLVSIIGHVDLALVLIGRDVDVTTEDKLGSTPLHQASESGHIELTRILLDHGTGATTHDEQGITPLHRAARRGHLEVVLALFHYGADINAQDNDGCTPLHPASQHGHLEIVSSLLDHDADADSRDNDNCNSLHRATQQGHLEIVRVLLERGGDVNARDHSNCTPLHIASQGGHSEVVRALLMCGADANASDLGGWTPLQLPSHDGHLEVVRVLLEHGIDANTRDNSNWTPLHGASQGRHLEVVRVLLQHGADVNSRDDSNETPLHLASRAGYLEVVQLLVKHNASLHIRNSQDRTAFQEASVKGHHNVMELLLDHGGEEVVG